MSKFSERFLRAAGAASVGGSAGASIGGSVVAGISAVGGEYSAKVEHPRPPKLNSTVAENEQYRRSSCTLTT